jgi:hypothetical protein
MEWHYQENQFDNITKRNNLRMVIVTNDHHSRLKAQQMDPEILELLTRTTPYHEAFLDAYTASKSAIALRKSATQGVNNKLKLLRSTKLRQWDAMVEVSFLSGTEEYIAIFPNGLTAFHTSKIDQTVSLLDGLQERMGAYAVLSAVQFEVGTFKTELEDIRDAQQGKEQIIEQSSTLLEQARVNLARIMYGNLGRLMDKYRDTPDFIGNYWELRWLRSANASSSAPPKVEEFSGSVAAGETVNITSNVQGVSALVVANTGTVPLVFCASADATTACGTEESLLLQPGAVYEATDSELNGLNNPYLNVTNNDAATEGSYNVEIVRGTL